LIEALTNVYAFPMPLKIFHVSYECIRRMMCHCNFVAERPQVPWNLHPIIVSPPQHVNVLLWPCSSAENPFAAN
jgi:hypothetical protein